MSTPIPDNGAPFTLDEMVSVTGGRLLRRGKGEARGVSTDSRRDIDGQAFVALTGERFDGHQYLETAVRRGARVLVVSRADALPVEPAVSILHVPDTLLALGELARHHRHRFSGPVVAIAGSVGKTTTRSAVSSVLTAVFGPHVHSTVGNLNNQIGVPMMLLGLTAHHRTAVVEIGTNQPGEVRALARLAAPDVAVLTRIDLEHTEFLGDLQGVVREEGALFHALGEHGVALGGMDEPHGRGLLSVCSASRKIGYGRAADALYRLVDREPRGLSQTALTVERPSYGGAERERVRFCIPLAGEAGALAMTAALAVADVLAPRPLRPSAVERAVAELPPGERGRLSPVELRDGTLVIDDTYNSSPASVAASLRYGRELADARGARLVAVLGEMRELGQLSLGEHQKIGEEILECRVQSLIGVSGDAEVMVSAAQKTGVDATFTKDADAALRALEGRVQSGDVVLVKGSRGVFLERVVEGLIRSQGGVAP